MERNDWMTRGLSRRTALRSGALGLAGLAGAALVGCGGNEATTAQPPSASATAAPKAAVAEARRGGILLVGGADPVHLDNTKSNSATTQIPAGPLYSTLLRMDPAKLPERVIGTNLALAEKWEIAEGGASIAFTLRKGVTWHDGKPFSSADVVATIERAKKVHPNKDLFANLLTVQAPDDSTAVFKLSKPTNYMLNLLAGTSSAIAPKHVITVDDKVMESKPVGTGPFQLESWTKGVSVVHKRNENYFAKAQGLPYLDGIRSIVLADTSAITNALRTGATHLAVNTSDVTADHVKLIQAAVPDVKVFKLSSGSFSPIWMNNTKPPFNDDRVRRAVSLVDNQQQWIDTVSASHARGGYASVGGLSDEKRKQLIPGYRGITPADIAAAKALMDAAGFKEGVTVDFLTSPNNDNVVSVAQAQLGQIGMKLKVSTLTYPAETLPAQQARRYEISITPWAFAMIHPVAYFSVNVTGDVDNRVGYSNKEYDALYQRLVSTLDAKELASLGEQLETILVRDVPWVLAWAYGYTNVVRPEVGGWPAPPYAREYMDYATVWLKA